MTKFNKTVLHFFALVLFLHTFSYGQKKYEYLGFLKIKDTTLISYRLNLQLKGSSVSGFSVTSIGGPHETKSYVKGSYDSETNTLQFKEYGIEYTKSDIDTYDFCFVNFSGKLKEIQKQFTIAGEFKGQYEDGVSCIDGELMVKSIEKIYKRAEKTDKKIKRLKIIPDSIKNNVSMTKTIDERRTNMLKANELTSVFCKSNKVLLKIWDSGKIDGDRITIKYNDKILVDNYSVQKEPKIFELELDDTRSNVTFLAENIGEIEPNTAMIEIVDSERNIKVVSNLKTKEKTTLVLHLPSKVQ